MSRHRTPQRSQQAAPRAVLLGACVAALVSVTPCAANAPSAPTWLVDAANSGADLPPVGRSLFDQLTATPADAARVPYPFDALLARISRNLASGGSGGGIERVLIPMGRSLQRDAAAPHYFAFPRIVAAVDGEPRAGSTLMLKDRLYLGYQEKANVIEVISYNEDAARFEFQIVRDYAPGATPRVVYANRAMCTSCHQNSGPIFSRSQWDETTANEAVAARIRAQAAGSYPTYLDGGVDVASAINEAIRRANRLALAQLVWNDGCGRDDNARRCRAALFSAAVAFRLTSLAPDAQLLRSPEFVALADAMRQRWPDGVAIPDPNIPNRNPLATGAESDAAARVDAAFDPLLLRKPLEIWKGARAGDVAAVVPDLGGFLPASDAAAVDAALSAPRSRGRATRTTLRVKCSVRSTRDAGRLDLDFDCGDDATNADALIMQARVIVDGRRVKAVIDRLQWGERSPLVDVAIADATAATGEVRGVPRRDGLAARFANADAIERVTLRWQRSSGSVDIVVVDDSARLDAAVATLLRRADTGRFDGFDARAFRRARLAPALLAALGSPAAARCCVVQEDLAPARVDTPALTQPPSRSANAGEAALALLYEYCSGCHLTGDATPPNFLAGDADAVRATLRQCAPRIYVRLAMGARPPDPHAKSAMPPAVALLRRHTSPEAWRDSADLAAMLDYAARLVESAEGRAPAPVELEHRYERLPPCLRAASGARAATLR